MQFFFTIGIKTSIKDKSIYSSAVHKRRPQSEEESVCSVRTFCEQGGGEGGLQMRTSALFGANHIEFFEI